jgi:threonine/homoserine/homoserine lactone efflux protein
MLLWPRVVLSGACLSPCGIPWLLSSGGTLLSPFVDSIVMELFSFIATIILVTGSGALAPGPLFFENLSQGARNGAKSGLVFSLAHTLVEFTLVMLLALGLLTFIHDLAVKRFIGVVGGAVLITYGTMQIRGSLASKFGEFNQVKVASSRLFLLGLALTGLNPFFIVWWLTAGAQLIIISLELASFAGVMLMYACHVWMDYLWLTGTAYLAKVGLNFAGLKCYRVLTAAFGAVLIYFGFNFLLVSL